MFKFFNPMNWLILKPTTIGEIISPEYSSVDSDSSYDKDVRSKPKNYSKTKKVYNGKSKKPRFNKTKFDRKRK